MSDMTTDVSMAALVTGYENTAVYYPNETDANAEGRRCLEFNFGPESTTSHYILFAFMLSCTFCHFLVIVICWKERKNATYKNDIVYMVCLAIVDILLSCTLPFAIKLPGLMSNVVYQYAILLLTASSLTLLTIRAIERFKMVVKNTSKPWTFKVQIFVCALVIVFVVIPLTQASSHVDAPIIRIYGSVCSIVILGSYAFIFWFMLRQYYKLKSAVQPIGLELCESKHKSHEPMPSVNGNTQLRVTLTSTTGLESPRAGTSNMRLEQPLDNTRLKVPRATTHAKMTGEKLKFICKNTRSVQTQTSNVSINTVPHKLTNSCLSKVPGCTKTEAVCTSIEETKVETNDPQLSRNNTPATIDHQTPASCRRKKLVVHVGFGLFLVTFIFYFSWLPVLLVSINDRVPCEILMIHLINYISNPFIYFIIIKKFRLSVIKMFQNAFKRNKFCKQG